MGFKTEISKIHYDKTAKGFSFNLLKFCSLFYGCASGLKNFLYDKDFLKQSKVNSFVISVGNLTTGGVGKTPVVSLIAKHFIEKDEKVAIVSRGYGAKLSNKNINVISDDNNIFFEADLAGDEPFWLAENTKGAVIITSKDRIKASKYAIDKFGVTRIILDDGFQHRKIYRDIDIVLIDSEKGFGNENLLPAGPLREGLEAFSRIDKLVVVSKNTDHTRAEKYSKIMNKKLKKETFVCYTEPDFIYNIKSSVNFLSESSIIAFSAIGQPQQFYNFLKNYSVLKTVDFDDHHNYSQQDADNLIKLCEDLGVKQLVTTEKDAVKLKDLNFGELNVFALKLKSVLDVEKLLAL